MRAVFLLLLLLGGCASVQNTTDVVTTINWTAEPSEPAGKTTRRLVSFNFDWHPADEGPTWGQNASLLTIDLQNARLRKLATAMSPAFLRLGGSEADDAVFNFSDACSKSRGGSGVVDPAYCLTPARWEEILQFAADTKLDVAFTLNVMYGRNCVSKSIFSSYADNCDHNNRRHHLSISLVLQGTQVMVRVRRGIPQTQWSCLNTPQNSNRRWG
jgi:hypothetical protein